MTCPGKFWNLLCSYAEGSFWLHIDVSEDENSHNCCHQVRFLGCRYAKNAFALPRTLLDSLERSLRPLAAVSRYIYTLLAYDRVPEKCFWRPGKVLELFVTKRVGTLRALDRLRELGINLE